MAKAKLLQTTAIPANIPAAAQDVSDNPRVRVGDNSAANPTDAGYDEAAQGVDFKLLGTLGEKLATAIETVAWAMDAQDDADAKSTSSRQSIAFAVMDMRHQISVAKAENEESIRNGWRNALVAGSKSFGALVSLATQAFVTPAVKKPNANTATLTEQEEYKVYAAKVARIRRACDFAVAAACLGIKRDSFDSVSHKFIVAPELIAANRADAGFGQWSIQKDRHAGVTGIMLAGQTVYYSVANGTEAFRPAPFAMTPDYVISVAKHNFIKADDKFAAKKLAERAAHHNTRQQTASDPVTGAPQTAAAGVTQSIKEAAAEREAEIANRKMVLETSGIMSLALAAARHVPAELKRVVASDKTTIALHAALQDLNRLRLHIEAGFEVIRVQNEEAFAKRKAANDKKAADDLAALTETRRIAAQQEEERKLRDHRADMASRQKNAAAAAIAKNAKKPAKKSGKVAA